MKFFQHCWYWLGHKVSKYHYVQRTSVIMNILSDIHQLSGRQLWYHFFHSSSSISINITSINPKKKISFWVAILLIVTHGKHHYNLFHVLKNCVQCMMRWRWWWAAEAKMTSSSWLKQPSTDSLNWQTSYHIEFHKTWR
jgi:hypothetical protein